MDPVSDFSSVMTNLLSTCRILCPAKQREIYRSLPQIYNVASETAKIYGIEIPTIDQFFPVLFEFPLLPISHSETVVTIAEHLEVLWDLFPLIMDSSGWYETDPGSCQKCLEIVWLAVKEKRFASEPWIDILLRSMIESRKKNQRVTGISRREELLF
jgi:hypothetical protein